MSSASDGAVSAKVGYCGLCMGWVRLDVGLLWTLMLTPACFTDPPSATDPAGTEADGSTASLTAASSDDTTGPVTVTGTTGRDPAGSSSGDDPGDTSGTTSSSSSGLSFDSSSSSADTVSTTIGPPPLFFDDFNRQNNEAIGNDWVEKLPAAWRILGQDVAAQDSTSNQYYDFLVSRPEVELDVLLQIDFRVSIPSGNNEPHLVLRAQESSLELGNPYHAYILVPRPGMDDLCIMRFVGMASPSGMICSTLPANGLVAGQDYRLTFSVQGDQPVQLDGLLELFDGAAFEEVASVSWLDDDVGMLISEPGFYGFSGGTGAAQLGNYRFDNFAAQFEG